MNLLNDVVVDVDNIIGTCLSAFNLPRQNGVAEDRVRFVDATHNRATLLGFRFLLLPLLLFNANLGSRNGGVGSYSHGSVVARHGFSGAEHGAGVALGPAKLRHGSCDGSGADAGAEVVVAVVSVLLTHEVAVADGRGVVSVERHAAHGAVEDGEANV